MMPYCPAANFCNPLRWTSLLVVAALFILPTCATYRLKDLTGQWQGALVLEEGDSLKIDPRIIRFEFDQNNSYRFFSTLNYRESGTFFLDHHSLVTTDTLNQASTEKAVEIVTLTGDSLHLKMRDGGRERLLKLVKVKN